MHIYQNLLPIDYVALSLVRADGAERLWLRAQRAAGIERLRLLALAQNLGIEAHIYREKAAA